MYKWYPQVISTSDVLSNSILSPLYTQSTFICPIMLWWRRIIVWVLFQWIDKWAYEQLYVPWYCSSCRLWYIAWTQTHILCFMPGTSQYTLRLSHHLPILIIQHSKSSANRRCFDDVHFHLRNCSPLCCFHCVPNVWTKCLVSMVLCERAQSLNVDAVTV